MGLELIEKGIQSPLSSGGYQLGNELVEVVLRSLARVRIYMFNRTNKSVSTRSFWS